MSNAPEPPDAVTLYFTTPDADPAQARFIRFSGDLSLVPTWQEVDGAMRMFLTRMEYQPVDVGGEYLTVAARLRELLMGIESRIGIVTRTGPGWLTDIAAQTPDNRRSAAQTRAAMRGAVTVSPGEIGRSLDALERVLDMQQDILRRAMTPTPTDRESVGTQNTAASTSRVRRMFELYNGPNYNEEFPPLRTASDLRSSVVDGELDEEVLGRYYENLRLEYDRVTSNVARRETVDGVPGLEWAHVAHPNDSEIGERARLDESLARLQAMFMLYEDDYWLAEEVDAM